MKGKSIIVGQSGGPTAAINASLAGVYTAALKANASHIYGMRYGINGLLNEEFVDLKTVIKSEEDLKLLKSTPSSFLGSCRYKLPDPDSNEGQPIFEKIFGILEKLEISAFLYIGGNDSMDTINKLSVYAKKNNSQIKFIGVPKTIDNDLSVTDHTPGYGSAAKLISSVTKEIICDSTVYDIKSVTVIEIMGRNAGWLTAASALAKGDDSAGPDMILLPETPFDPEEFIKRIEQIQQTKKSIVIAVSEGIKLADGSYVCALGNDSEHTDVFGHTQLTGTASCLANLIKNRLSIKARAIEFSTIQRCASHISSLTDIEEAFLAGSAAVEAAEKGHTAEMVILSRVSNNPYKCVTKLHDISDIANVEKVIPKNWIDAENYALKDEFFEYARPLIQGQAENTFKNGLPCHIKPIA